MAFGAGIKRETIAFEKLIQLERTRIRGFSFNKHWVRAGSHRSNQSFPWLTADLHNLWLSVASERDEGPICSNQWTMAAQKQCRNAIRAVCECICARSTLIYGKKTKNNVLCACVSRWAHASHINQLVGQFSSGHTDEWKKIRFCSGHIFFCQAEGTCSTSSIRSASSSRRKSMTE